MNITYTLPHHFKKNIPVQGWDNVGYVSSLSINIYIYILCTMESDFMDIFIAELLAADMFLKT